ncbi:MAG: DUF2849 domain-containing protein [Alphaproteobacteria bacterium]|nr:MAG: DUF2849 domain-containing protein [Alphaproteobacteria bacterium]
MAKPFRPGLISANHLATGRVIYRAASGAWVARPEEAEFIADADTARARLEAASTESLVAVGPYLAPARLTEAGPRPDHLREALRASGPSARARASWGHADA